MITAKPLPIKDPNIIIEPRWQYCNTKDFADYYKKWILSSTNCKIFGLDNFNYYLTDGVTGAFSDFEKSFSHLKSVVFRGEYPFHRDTGCSTIDHISELKFGQKLYISCPFAAHGCVHFNFDLILESCEKQNIPVFIDMAYFGACSISSLDLNYKCIKFIGFSMSKAFGTGFCKIGLCFTNEKNTFMELLNQYSYVNHVSIGIHQEIIKNFSPDYLYNKYRQKQIEICNKFDFNTSDTVFLGYTDTPKIKGFDREGTVSRFGISDLLINGYDREIEWVTK